ncbi:hypothetical protein V495_02160, partial [Pseudogymnoascus sp. VKM F-4514 (FW-929)]
MTKTEIALQPNSDISGIGVIIGFVGIAYLTFILLILQYLVGQLSSTNLDGSTNPIDRGFLAFFWGTLRCLWELLRKWVPLRRVLPSFRKPSERFATTLAMSDVQIVTGIAILASGFAQLNCGLSIYHWHMIVHLAWFSSVTHLTALTFLRRYFHDNPGIRTLRLFFMLLLVLALAVAFIPTGGPCGMEYINPEAFQRNLWISGIIPYTLRFPGSPAMCCYTKMSNTGRFIDVYPSGFISMMISEVLLFSSSLTRAVKLFRKSTEFSKTLLRHKPAQMCFARAVYDTVDSILFEIYWLFLYLIWGTLRMVADRGFADEDYTAKIQDQSNIVLQENSWGFGQLLPTLLLILPLFSLIEGAIVILKFKPTGPKEADNSTAAVDDLPLSNTLSVEESHRDLLPSRDLSAEQDISTNINMVQLRTGTDLSNMESDLGTSTVIR